MYDERKDKKEMRKSIVEEKGRHPGPPSFTGANVSLLVIKRTKE